MQGNLDQYLTLSAAVQHIHTLFVEIFTLKLKTCFITFILVSNVQMYISIQFQGNNTCQCIDHTRIVNLIKYQNINVQYDCTTDIHI